VTRSRIAVILAIATLACSCHPAPETKEQPHGKIVWHTVRTLSGRGNAQTESFDIGYAPCRVLWETRNETKPGAGTFRVAVDSAVSGRELQVAVDHNGPGQDMAYISVEPHWSYLVIESANLDWTVTVEEGRLETADTK
jgi:hypothetical protein